MGALVRIQEALHRAITMLEAKAEGARARAAEAKESRATARSDAAASHCKTQQATRNVAALMAPPRTISAADARRNIPMARGTPAQRRAQLEGLGG